MVTIFILSSMVLLNSQKKMIKMKPYQDQLDEIKEMYNGRPEGFRDHLRQRSKELCPDYPWSEEPDPFECLYAITSSIEGTNMANEDCHKLIKILGGKLGLSAEQVYDLWKEMENHAI